MAFVPDAPIPIDLGLRNPLHLPQIARAALIQGSEYDISEGPIPEVISTPTPAPGSVLLGDEAFIDINMFDATEPADLLADLPARPSPPSSDVFEHSKTSEPAIAINLSAAAAGVALESQAILDDKMKVFRTFCAAFDETAKQFPTGRMFRFAQQMSQSFLSHWASALNGDSQTQSQPQLQLRLPAVSQPARSYASALATDLPIRRAAEPEFDDFQPARTRGNAPDPQRRPPRPRQARQPQEQQQQENPAIAYDDTRVFVRLHENSPAWDKQPFAIRTHLADKLGIKLDAIPQASRTKTGWAIRPADLDIRNKIINEEACWAPALGADAVELATKWITYVVSECPRSLTDLLGKTVDYEAALKDEVEAQTGLRAVSCRPSRLDDPTQPTKTLLISFLEQPKHAFRLFGTSRLARLIRKTAKPNQCNLCWDYHSRHSCDRTARCVSCGRTPHEGMPCEHETQCLNCRGPHPSDDGKCPARPRRQNGALKRPTQPEKRGIREIGERLFRQLHPEVAAAAAGSSPAPEAGARPSSPCEALTLRPTKVTPPPSPHKRRRQAPETPI